MLTDAEVCDWPEQYRQRCLGGAEVSTTSERDSPIRARLRVSSQTPNGMPALVEHFLLRLPRRR